MSRNKYRRRDFLLQGLATGSLFLPFTHALVWAQQSDGAKKLLRLPKVALVIGNSRYQNTPPLKNPANDAKAIAETLQQAGFAVDIKQDLSRREMLVAINSYADLLETKKCVGLFYFAGHGLQLAWKNYLIPVDASIGQLKDIALQGVDVTTLMARLTTAANAMNIVILDACRDNPFGKEANVDQKGLSQLDAPPSTLLAYATSPGNVASDGDGANGLYTENLLREMRVRDAKIEDVFKRVRLSVRRKSAGAQIPWESTSLEEDFYFLPPEQLKTLSVDERENEYREQASKWEKVRGSKQVSALEGFLQRYPAGEFSELAQFQLDRLLHQQGEKRIQVVSSVGNPYTKGSSTANTAFRVGDRYEYRKVDILTGVESEQLIRQVVNVSEDRVEFSSGFSTDLLGNDLTHPNGLTFSAHQRFPLEYAIGKKWSTRFVESRADGSERHSTLDLAIVAREKITVPAGTFDVFHIQGSGYSTFSRGVLALSWEAWMAPDQLRRPVAEQLIRRKRGAIRSSNRFELVNFLQS